MQCTEYNTIYHAIGPHLSLGYRRQRYPRGEGSPHLCICIHTTVSQLSVIRRYMFLSQLTPMTWAIPYFLWVVFWAGMETMAQECGLPGNGSSFWVAWDRVDMLLYGYCRAYFVTDILELYEDKLHMHQNISLYLTESGFHPVVGFSRLTLPNFTRINS